MDLVILTVPRTGHYFIKNNLLSWKNYYNYINFESVTPQQCLESLNTYNKNDVDIIILTRDLLNWLASYLKLVLNDTNIINLVYNRCGIWEIITKEVFNETNIIKNKISIIYDEFKLNSHYRKKICNKINGDYNEDQLNIVPHYGYYSSFDGDSYQNIGNKMETDKRYEYFLNNDGKDIYFDVLKKHPNAISLYEKYFNITNKQKEIINSIK